ncbi:MAG: hypothetical protein Q8J89_14770 [Caulobacter sp.]|nr:hypothetical protein [Caulobacter sp.]
MRALQVLAVILALSTPSAVLARDDRPMSREGLVAAIKSDRAWCAGWRETDQSCEEIVFLEAVGDAVSQTRRYRIYEGADFEMVVRNAAKIDAGKLCWTYRFAEMEVAFLEAGVRAAPEQAAAMTVVLRETMADLEGKVACEAFSRDDATGEIAAAATLDGERAPEFDSRFRLLAPDTRVKLRGVFEDKPEPTTT